MWAEKIRGMGESPNNFSLKRTMVQLQGEEKNKLLAFFIEPRGRNYGLRKRKVPPFVTTVMGGLKGRVNR